MALSYFDKAIIFLLPLIVLQLFNDQTVYLSIEYIYSITIVIIPFLDLGLSGYFFYIYRNEINKRKVINDITKIFHIIYLVLFIICILLIVTHYFCFKIDEFIIYITSRALFVVTFSFLASYYRLINKPHKGLFVTIIANVLSLTFLFIFYFSKQKFDIWLIFIGQILFCIYYFVKITLEVIEKWHKHYKKLEVLQIIKASLIFSWPSITQVFIMMYIANYGKINALDKMSLDEGTLLSITQRFSMLIQITHTAIIAYLLKEIYTQDNIKLINKKILFKYLGLLSLATFFVLIIIIGYLMFKNYNLTDHILIIGSIVSYTYIWCIIAYFEIYFSRENKNIINLYLAVINAILFITILNISGLEFLEKLTLAMFISTAVTLFISSFILRKRKYILS